MKFSKGLFISLVAISFILALAQFSVATTTPNSAITIQSGNVGIGTYTANPGTYSTIYTGATNGSMVKGLIASNLDTTTDHVVTCRIVSASSVVGLQLQQTVPHQTGVIAPVNLLSAAPGLPVDQWGNLFTYLPYNYTIQCTYATALSNNYVAITTEAGEF